MAAGFSHMLRARGTAQHSSLMMPLHFTNATAPYQNTKACVGARSSRCDTPPAWAARAAQPPPAHLATSQPIRVPSTAAAAAIKSTDPPVAIPRRGDTVTVHVREGYQYRALIRIARKACVKAQLDEVLPPPSPEDLAHRYVLLRPPDVTPDPQSDDYFWQTQPPAGLLLRRTTLGKALACRVVMSPEGLREAAAVKRIRRRGVHAGREVCQRTWAAQPPTWAELPRLTPVALPTTKAFLEAAGDGLRAYNSELGARPVQLLPGSMLRAVSAAVSIQAAWRAHRMRCVLPLTATVVRHRAALCVQRAWRGRLMRQHTHALAAAAALAQALSALSIVPSLCLTLLSARMLGMTQARAHQCLPGHRLQWSFLETTGGAHSQAYCCAAPLCPSVKRRSSSLVQLSSATGAAITYSVAAEVVLVASDSASRPHIPTWIGCRIAVIPHSLCSYPCACPDPDADSADIRVDAASSDASVSCREGPEPPCRPAWFTDTHLVQRDGVAHLRCEPLGSPDCLQLLEHDTDSHDLIAANDRLGADVAEDDALRLFTFANVAEARRRAVLLLLLTYDPMLGAPTVPRA